MSSEIKLEDFDQDGAIAETAHEATEALGQEGDTRLDFLKKAGVAGGTVVGGGALLGALVPGTAMAAGGRPPKSFGKGDIGILNYALTLEYLEAEFYKEAARMNRQNRFLRGFGEDFLRAVVKDEKAHVKFLENELGNKAIKKPKFDFRRTTRRQKPFLDVAFALENTGVGAYFGQGFNIQSKEYLAAAISILTVEARHAGLVGALILNAKGVAPDGPFDKPVNAKDTLKAVKSLGFIVG